jgi:acetyl-CoA acetyltransferase family protein
MADREVVFVDAVRTAFGRMGGTIRHIIPSKLAGIGIKGLVEKTKIKERGKVDAVFLGSAAHCVQALNPARWATLEAGLPYETSAAYVEMQCGSAIESINHAAAKILAGMADVIIAGGMESYSQVFAKFSTAVEPFKMLPPMPVAGTLSPVAEESIGMGLTAENLQVMYNIPREEIDEFAYHSQIRAAAAIKSGKFKEEIIPITIPGAKGKPDTVFEIDEHVRGDTTLEGLAKLKPVFKKDGTVTAGNASGRNDGSAFVLMMTAQKAKELGYKPMAKWITGADIGCDPRIMGIAPGYAMPMAIKRARLKLSDMAHMECNEAFAVQNLAVIREIEKQTGEKVDMKKWNPLGGAIAFGHPNGASGARIGMFTMHELIRNGGKYGIFGSCCGGGLGVCTVVENLQR